jgi:hypothetical protein
MLRVASSSSVDPKAILAPRRVLLALAVFHNLLFIYLFLLACVLLALPVAS